MQKLIDQPMLVTLIPEKRSTLQAYYRDFEKLVTAAIEKSLTSWRQKMDKWMASHPTALFDEKGKLIPSSVAGSETAEGVDTPPDSIQSPLSPPVDNNDPDASTQTSAAPSKPKKITPPSKKLLWQADLKTLICDIVHTEIILFAMLYRWKDIVAGDEQPPTGPVCDPAIRLAIDDFPVPKPSTTAVTSPTILRRHIYQHIDRIISQQTRIVLAKQHPSSTLQPNTESTNPAIAEPEVVVLSSHADIGRQVSASKGKDHKLLDILYSNPVFGLNVAYATAAREKAEAKEKEKMEAEAKEKEKASPIVDGENSLEGTSVQQQHGSKSGGSAADVVPAPATPAGKRKSKSKIGTIRVLPSGKGLNGSKPVQPIMGQVSTKGQATATWTNASGPSSATGEATIMPQVTMWPALNLTTSPSLAQNEQSSITAAGAVKVLPAESPIVTTTKPVPRKQATKRKSNASTPHLAPAPSNTLSPLLNHNDTMPRPLLPALPLRPTVLPNGQVFMLPPFSDSQSQSNKLQPWLPKPSLDQ